MRSVGRGEIRALSYNSSGIESERKREGEREREIKRRVRKREGERGRESRKREREIRCAVSVALSEREE